MSILRLSFSWRDVVVASLAAILYYAVARLGLLFVVAPEGIASFWPASGLAVGALLHTPRRDWAMIVAGLFGGSWLANATAGMGGWPSFGFSVVNASESLAAAWLYARWQREAGLTLSTPRAVTRLASVAIGTALLAGLAGATLAATVGASASFVKTWGLWFAADGMGMVALVPILLSAPMMSRPRACLACAESLLMFATTVLLAGLLCGWNGPTRPLVMNYPIAILLPNMLWAGLRFDVGRAAIAAGIVSTVFCLATTQGAGPFASPLHDNGQRVAATQFACMAWSLSGIVLAAGAAGAAELRRLRVLAESAADAKSAFIANVSHDIRTPLSTIIGYASLMRRKELPRDACEKYLGTIHRSGEHLLRLLNDVLDLSKIEAGKLGVEVIAVRTQDVMSDLVDLLSERAASKQIGFVVRVAPDVPATFDTDPTRLRQILYNLAGNAVKFTSRGGVSIACDVDGKCLRFAVSDTGIGMAPSEVAGLFASFHQTDPGHARRFGGTGLGLSISQRLAGLLAGRIEVRSERGVGSTFTLYLPVARATRLNDRRHADIPPPAEPSDCTAPLPVEPVAA